MLQVPSQFPYPGSVALLDGLSVKVQRHNADGTATVSREGQGASFRRDAPLADLVDPKEAERNAALTLGNAKEADTRIALWIGSHLRNSNQVGLYTLRRDLTEAARIGRCPDVDGYPPLSRILRVLGWTKRGTIPDRHGRQPLYVRGES